MWVLNSISNWAFLCLSSFYTEKYVLMCFGTELFSYSLYYMVKIIHNENLYCGYPLEAPKINIDISKTNLYNFDPLKPCLI